MQDYPTVGEIVEKLRSLKAEQNLVAFREYIDKYLIDPYEVHVPAKLRADIGGVIYSALSSGATESDVKPDEGHDWPDELGDTFDIDTLPVGSLARIVGFKGLPLSQFPRNHILGAYAVNTVLKTVGGCFVIDGVHPGQRFENNLYNFKIIS